MSDVSFPYVASYKKIPEFFTTIQTAAVPDKVTTRVLANTFEFKGTNDRPLIGVLRSLGFIDENGVPMPVPKLELITEDDKRRYNDALKRREFRMSSRHAKQ